MNARLLLINPPVTRAVEPPAGLARLAGALRGAGSRAGGSGLVEMGDVGVDLWDANLDGLLHLLRESPDGSDTWTRRSWRDLAGHLDGLRSGVAFAHPDTYRRAVGDLQRLLARNQAARQGWRVSLTDCAHDALRPTASADLRAAAADPEGNPFAPLFVPELARRLEVSRPTHVGISVGYLGQALTAAALAGHLRRVAPAVRIILGGGLVTSWLSRPSFRNPLEGVVDHLVSGPGEAELAGILGVDRVSRMDADFRGFPLTAYLSPGLVLPVSLSSGCYWSRCSFCPETAERVAYRPLVPREAIAFLKRSVAAYRPRLVHLLDNAIGRAHLAALAETAIGAPWYGFVRFERALLDPVFCRALGAAGCRMLQLGLESGDQAVLDALGKGNSLPEVSLVLRNLREAGIGTYVYLLFGTPPETLDSARRTLVFVADHAQSIDFLNLAIFNLPIEGGEAAGLDTSPFSDGDLSLYLDFRHPRGWGRKAVRRFLDEEFRRHPAIAPILRRDPPAFTSSHAPFFLPPAR